MRHAFVVEVVAICAVLLDRSFKMEQSIFKLSEFKVGLACVPVVRLQKLVVFAPITDHSGLLLAFA